ncbi:MAG TPA: hypothetical protein VFD91_08520 [Mariniphaga sp.]|nr:hypothetical protein [Mariniphaga sp.]
MDRSICTPLTRASRLRLSTIYDQGDWGGQFREKNKASGRNVWAGRRKGTGEMERNKAGGIEWRGVGNLRFIGR